MEGKIAVYPGSFDPVHNGHIHTVERALELFDQVYVLIAMNPVKKQFMSPEERKEVFLWYRDFWAKAMSGSYLPMAALKVVTLPQEEFTVTYANSVGARYLIRGLRNDMDFRYEQTLQHANAKLCEQFGIHELETLYLGSPLNDELYTSSSLLRGFIGMRDWQQAIASFVPGPTMDILRKKFAHGSAT